MKVKMKKLLTLLTASVMVLAMSVTAFADVEVTPQTDTRAYDASDTNGDGLTSTVGTTVKLKKHLVVEKDVTIPRITFTYTLAPGTAVAESEGKLPVYAGVSGATVGSVSFNSQSTTQPGASDNPAKSSDKKYASGDIAINFGGVTFDHPGVYRYILTEQEQTAVTGVSYDTEHSNSKVRTIDVYVEDNNGALQIKGYVAYVGTVTAAPAQTYDPAATTQGDYANGDPNGSKIEGQTKSNQYVNEISTNKLKVTKEITGNQGDKTTSWNIKVDFVDANNAAITGVTYAKTKENGQDVASPTYGAYTSGTEISFNHNDEYTFVGIPEGAKYTVTETSDAAAKGYTATYSNQEYTYTADAQGAVETKDAKVTNNRTGTVPTGMFLNYKPFWLMGVVAAGLVIAFALKRRDRYADEI